ncbi:MAG TPA: autotransporter-associated beta strand repeat-containing protein [bacterium]|nr:autotransporter-associated beta strand repeat-containing protein [bacterium]
MKTEFSTSSLTSQIKYRVSQIICIFAAGSALAATEQWQGVPGASATTNWTDAANWTAPQQTYYNQVQFTGVGANNNLDFSVNNVLDAATGVAQMPIWELDYVPTNGNYTTLINPGTTLTLGAGWGSLYVGADALHNSSPAPADAFETITITGPGAAMSIGGNMYIGQGSTTPGDNHNVTLDLSGLDNFTISGSQILVASGGLQRGNGTLYLAKTNNLSLGNNFQVSNQNLSNSLPCAVYLGQQNTITLGSGDLTVAGTGTTTAGAWMKFNPAFIGGPVPTANFYGSQGSGRIANFTICNANGGAYVPGYGLGDFTGGNVSMMVDTMRLGLAGPAGINALGVLTLDAGTVDVNYATVGNQGSSSGGSGVGIINLNSNSVAGLGATLKVNNTLTLAAVTGTLTPGSAGTININGGALVANNIVNGGGTASINLANGGLTLSGTAGTVAAPVSTLTATNSVLNLALMPASNSIVATTLTTGGTTNIITIVSAPPIASYPVQIPLIKYSGSIGGSGFNFGLGTLPPLYAGQLVNNSANSTVDLLLTAGSSTLTWTGSNSGDWDMLTANWTSGGPAVYGDGDYVQFYDGANNNTVNMTTAVSPAGTIVSNSSPAYTFTGSGSIGGSGSLLKQGSGTLVIDNTGNNVFTGGVTISGGTVQVGNNDMAGNLPAGAITDNGSLTFARSDSLTINNNISGTGSVQQAGAGSILTLSGANTFTGNVLITNGSTLKVGSSSALGTGGGSVIVANGSTLDINGNYGTKSVVVSGSGVDGNGAITDSGGAVYGYTSSLTLAGDTTLGFPNRWDLSSATLGTGGNAYNLTLNGSGYFQWNNVTLDTALANINLTAGTWGVVGSTSFGNPGSTLTLSLGATLIFYNPNVYMNKQVDFQSGATISVGGGDHIMNGAMTLEAGYCSFNIGGGTSLTLSNVLSGSGTIYLNGGNGILVLGGNSPSYSGDVALYTGSVILNGNIGGTITSQSATIVAGSGAASGLVDVSGTLLPGKASVAGTFHAQGGLTLEGGATVTSDLSASTGGNNDLVEVTGDLTVNNNDIAINPVGGQLANGTYTLFTYTGNLNGSFGTVATTFTTAYSLVLTNVSSTSPKKIQLIVTGNSTSSLLVWNNAGGNGEWDVQTSANWSNVTTHAASDQFHFLDSVVFDDSILSATIPATNVVISSGQIVVPSAITNNSTLNYTLSGAGKISGAGSLVKSGSGTLGLNVAGDFTGTATVSGGTLQTLGSNTLSAVASVNVANTGTLDFAGSYMTGNKPVTVSGSGSGGKGALFNSGGGVYGNLITVTLAGDAVFGASSRWDLATGSQISGAHNLTIDWSAGAGYGEWNSVSIGTNVAGITLTNGNIGMKSMDTAFQNSATVFTVSPNNEMVFWNGGFNGSLNLLSGSQLTIYSSPTGWTFNGSTITFENGARLLTYGNSGNEPINSAITLNGIAHIRLGDHNLLLTNTVSGPGGFLMEYWNHQMILSASNTYTGPTIINQGGNSLSVALTGSGSISHSSLIFFGGGDPASTRMDVSGRSDLTFTLADGQTLAGVGAVNGKLTVSPGATLAPAGTNITLGITAGANATGTISASSDIALNGITTLKLNGSGVNDQIKSATSIAYGGTLNLVNISGSPLAVGNSFEVFNAPGYSGSFTNIAPATPGAGLAWDLSQLNIGFVNVVTAGGSGPVVNSPQIVGGNLILSGTGGAANSTYHVLTTTNLTTPLVSWDVLTNGTFDASGNFSSTNAVGTANQQFYIIKQP